MFEAIIIMVLATGPKIFTSPHGLWETEQLCMFDVKRASTLIRTQDPEAELVGFCRYVEEETAI